MNETHSFFKPISKVEFSDIYEIPCLSLKIDLIINFITNNPFKGIVKCNRSAIQGGLKNLIAIFINKPTIITFRYQAQSTNKFFCVIIRQTH